MTTLTEEQIERRVEYATDRIDKKYMQGELSHDEYQAALKAMDKWSESEYDRISLEKVNNIL